LFAERMAARTIYFGRFISAPKPDGLLIKIGAVLVSSRDGRGVIEKVDWTVNGPNDALSKFGIEVPVITAHDDGFFFPGFIGKSIQKEGKSLQIASRCKNPREMRDLKPHSFFHGLKALSGSQQPGFTSIHH